MCLLGLAALSSPVTTFAAEAYPSRPVHLIVGFTAGATSDVKPTLSITLMDNFWLLL
jgi:tripartite-type tricarboxylate transporter receptor subunit TctC